MKLVIFKAAKIYIYFRDNEQGQNCKIPYFILDNNITVLKVAF